MSNYDIQPLENVFGKPGYYPPAGTHPRIYMTEKSLPRVRDNLSHPDHKFAFEQMMTLSDTAIPKDDPTFRQEILDAIRAKALRALLYEDGKYAAEAKDAVLYFLRNVIVPKINDPCRAYGALMYAAACVYDWCFSYLSADEREEIVFLCETKLGPHFEVGYPPVGQSNFTGHGCEAQIMRDWLSLGLAAYDEHPDIYELIAGRIYTKIKPAHDHAYQSGSHWQGSSYGPYRYMFDLTAEALLYAVSDGKCHVFDKNMEEAMTTFLHYFRADGEFFRIGDDPHDKYPRYLRGKVHIDALLAGTIYNNPSFREYAYEKEIPADFEVVLAFDDPAIGRSPVRLAAVRYNGSPLCQYIVKTKNGASAYMKIGESLSLNHEQKDAGDFMIFYKGSLASASNCYEYTDREGKIYRYGSALDFGYNKQTISHNCVLVFDPDENCYWKNAGGQKVDKINTWEVSDLEEWLKSDAYHRAKEIAHADATDADGDFSFAYIAGDLTNAYSDKITHYERHMLAVRGDDAHPLYFFVYDGLKVKNPAFEKTFLLHMTDEPKIEGNEVRIHSFKSGRLDATTLLPDGAKLTAVGGGDDLFLVRGERLGKARNKAEHPVREDGWGRVEVTPSADTEETEFLHVMVAKDGDAVTLPAKSYSMKNGVSAAVGDVCFVLIKDPKRKITLPDLPDSLCRIFVCGLPAGEYDIDGVTAVVKPGEGLLYIKR